MTSDLHGFLPLVLGECDVLVVAGDIGLYEVFKGEGDLDTRYDRIHGWITELQGRGIEVVAIAGNHDFDEVLLRSLPWTYLQDEAFEFSGYRFWGSPWSPTFGDGWAFNASEKELHYLYSKVPDDTEILISHCPPKWSCDLTDPKWGSKHVGSDALRERMATLPNLKLLACGHIHPGYGIEGVVVNGSLVNSHYEPVNQVVIVEV